MTELTDPVYGRRRYSDDDPAFKTKPPKHGHQGEWCPVCRAAALREVAAKIGALPIGWTRPEDQFGPQQYAWLYRNAVLAILAEATGASE